MPKSLKQELVGKYYPIKRIHPFKLLLEEETKKVNVVLDAGCGSGRSFHYNYKIHLKSMIGIDLLFMELIQNRQIHSGCVADLENLPFVDQSFDLIFSHDVIEHLKQPDIVFAEFSRVLKPGGKLMVLTPNNYHYFAVAGHIIPHSLQKAIVRKLFKNTDEVFKTYYRCNSIKGMTALASKVGMEPVNICLYEPPPTYLTFNPLCFYPALVYERMVNRFNILSPFRAQLIGIFQKNRSLPE